MGQLIRMSSPFYNQSRWYQRNRAGDRDPQPQIIIFADRKGLIESACRDE